MMPAIALLALAVFAFVLQAFLPAIDPR